MAEDSSAMKFMLQVLVEAQQAVAAAAEIRKLGNEFRKAKTEADSMEAAAEKAAAKSASRGKKQTEDAKEYNLALRDTAKNIRDTSASEYAILSPIKSALDLKKEALELAVKARRETVAANQEAANAVMAERDNSMARLRGKQDDALRAHFGLPPAIAAETAAAEQGMERAARSTQRSAGMFGMAAGTAANSANRSRYVMFQLTSAFQDFAIVLQNGGNVERALLGASNNFGVLASAAGGTAAVLGTIAVIAIPSLIGAMTSAARETESFSSRLKRLTEDTLELRKSNIEVAASFRDISKARQETEAGLGSKEQVEGRASFKDKYLGEVTREMFQANPAEREKARIYFMQQELAKNEAEETKVARIRQEAIGTVVKQSAHDLAGQMAATQSSRGRDPVTGRTIMIPGEQAFRHFFERGEIDKLLTAAGMREPSEMSRYGDQIAKIIGPIKGQVPGGPAGGMRFRTNEEIQAGIPEVEKRLSDIMVKALEKASRTEAGITALPTEEMKDAARNLAEIRKQTPTKQAEERAKAVEKAEAVSRDVLQGKDLTNLAKFLDPEVFRVLTGQGFKRAQVESETDAKEKVRVFDIAAADQQRNIDIRKLEEDVATKKEGRDKELEERQIKASRRASQDISEAEATDAKRKALFADLVKNEKSLLNEARAALELLVPPSEKKTPFQDIVESGDLSKLQDFIRAPRETTVESRDALIDSIKKSESVKIEELEISRDSKGLLQNLQKILDQSLKAQQEAAESLKDIVSGLKPGGTEFEETNRPSGRPELP